MKKLFLLTFLSALAVWMIGTRLTSPRSVEDVFAQTTPDCTITATFTTATSGTAFNNKPTSSSGVGCIAWTVRYWTNGASGVSVQIEGAADSGGSPSGSYTALTPATSPVTTTNPATGTASGEILACCDYYPWIRITVNTFTGTSQTMTVRAYGYRAVGQVATGGGGGTPGPSGPSGPAGATGATGPGGGSTAWSSLTDPTGALNLNMGNNPTVWTFSATSGVSGFHVLDTTANTGSGPLWEIHSTGTSNAVPFQTTAKGVTDGVRLSTAGVLGAIGAGHNNADFVNGAAVPTSATALASNGSNQLIAATYQGNGAKVQLSTGSTTTDDCVKFDANGNTVDSGGACGGGGGGGSITQPYFTLGGSTYGPIWDMTIPDALGSWTVVNSASGTGGGTSPLAISVPGSSGASNIRALVETLPTAPYTITALSQAVVGCCGTQRWGLVLRESGSGKLITFDSAVSSSTAQEVPHAMILKWTNPTTFSGYYVGSGSAAGPQFNAFTPMWFRIQNDNTNLLFSSSVDGINFIQLFSVAKGDFITIDQAGFQGNDEAGVQLLVSILSYKVTTP